jgi:hypothetical protein
MNDATFSEGGRETVASYASYVGAQRAVGALSDAGFPVESVAIVGHDVRLVDSVDGTDLKFGPTSTCPVQITSRAVAGSSAERWNDPPGTSVLRTRRHPTCDRCARRCRG